MGVQPDAPERFTMAGVTLDSKVKRSGRKERFFFKLESLGKSFPRKNDLNKENALAISETCENKMKPLFILRPRVPESLRQRVKIVKIITVHGITQLFYFVIPPWRV